jgi:hypothetical protein
MVKRSLTSLFSLLLILALAAPLTLAQDRRSRLGAKGRAGLSAGAGGAVGAGIGALLGGRRGAATGALLGGGGATAAWLLKNDRSRRRLGKYGQSFATIGAGSALGAGVGNLIDRRGKKGAAVGALLGGGATTAGYLLAKRRNNNRYAYNSAPTYSSRYRSTRTTRTRRTTRRACRC